MAEFEGIASVWTLAVRDLKLSDVFVSIVDSKRSEPGDVSTVRMSEICIG